MESILNSVTQVENHLTLVENLIENIFVFELPEGNLVINLRFNQSLDHEPRAIGGLTATIQEFAGETDDAGIRSISLEELNLLFYKQSKFLIVFAVDPNYPDEQFEEAIVTFSESFLACLKNQEYGSTIDGAAVATQTLHNLISEDIHMEVQLGTKVTIYPFKLRELADKTAQEILGFGVDSSVDLYDDTEDQQKLKEELNPIKNQKEALYKMLGQFISTFADVKEITLIRTTLEGTFEKYTKTHLEQSVSRNVYDIVLNMIDAVSNLLEGELEDRCIDLDDELILFHKVSDYSFMYLVFEGQDSLEFIEPIVERIGSSISNLFPDEVQL